jgi:internalin A
VLRSGDLISGFMKRIGLADNVIVVLSDKYLRSPYCMTELYFIYQRSLGEKEDFLRRIVPLALEDARFGNRRVRLVYTKHWTTEFEEMEQHYVNDVLVPLGFDEIVKDDFAELRRMLARRHAA